MACIFQLLKKIDHAMIKLHRATNGYPLRMALWVSYASLSTKTHDDVIKMETFSALLALCVGNSPVTGKFPAQRPVTRSFDFIIDLRLNKRLNKQSWSWWFETPQLSLWRHCKDKWFTPIFADILLYIALFYLHDLAGLIIYPCCD